MTPLERLASCSPSLAEGFSTMRQGVFEAGPLTETMIELIVIGALATAEQPGALGVHIKRLIALGVDAASIRQALVAPLGAASTLTATVDALALADRLLQGES